jgi:hypothetical protein
MGKADFLKLGDYNSQCYECGMKFKDSMLKMHWKGYKVCPEHWEPRQPQDFVRGTTDDQTVPHPQPQPAPVFAPGAPNIPIPSPSDYPIHGDD